jgi:hypothetical protein
VTSSCTFTKRDGTTCKRRARAGQRVCWQHARGPTARWRSLPPKYQWLGLCLTAVSVILTIAFGLPLIWTVPGPKQPAVNNTIGNPSTIVVREATSPAAALTQPAPQRAANGNERRPTLRQERVTNQIGPYSPDYNNVTGNSVMGNDNIVGNNTTVTFLRCSRFCFAARG